MVLNFYSIKSWFWQGGETIRNCLCTYTEMTRIGIRDIFLDFRYGYIKSTPTPSPRIGPSHGKLRHFAWTLYFTTSKSPLSLPRPPSQNWTFSRRSSGFNLKNKGSNSSDVFLFYLVSWISLLKKMTDSFICSVLWWFNDCGIFTLNLSGAGLPCKWRQFRFDDSRISATIIFPDPRLL